MVYLILDTNNWLYLANSRDPNTDNFDEGRHFVLFKKLKSKIDSGEIKLLICDIIYNEWLNNKKVAEELIEKIKNRITNYAKTINDIKKHLEEQDKETIALIFNKFENKVNDIISSNTEHVSNIENLLGSIDRYDITTEIKAFTSDWAVEKKAPFIGDKKNSTADALIFFGVIDYIKNISKNEFFGNVVYDYPISIFVSSNKGDFSSKSDNNQIHEHLKSHLDSVDMKFFNSLPKSLNFIDETLIKQNEIEEFEHDIDDYEDNSFNCLVCDPGEENVLMNVLYFSEPYEIENDIDLKYDPNQLMIPFLDLESIEQKKIKKSKYKIQSGNCMWCGAEHFKCQICGEVFGLSDDFEKIHTCDGCGIKYQIEKIQEDKGSYYKKISVTDKSDDDEEEDEGDNDQEI